MLRSMTGYGNAESKNKKFTFNVEIKSVNNRFLDLVLKTNSISFPYEKEVIEILKEKCFRGRINLNLNITSNNEENELWYSAIIDEYSNLFSQKLTLALFSNNDILLY